MENILYLLAFKQNRICPKYVPPLSLALAKVRAAVQKAIVKEYYCKMKMTKRYLI